MKYLDPLVESFEANVKEDDAEQMKRYMRDKFEFLGIKAQKRRDLLRAFIATEGLPDQHLLRPVVRELWRLPRREYQYCGIEILDRTKRGLTADAIALCEELITTKSWWDSVDGMASKIVGHLFRTFTEEREKHIRIWRSSENIWLRRTTIIFQLKYGNETDWELLADLCRENARSSEFFIQKAMGWALRQYSKYEPEIVTGFVASNELPKLSSREALKWITSHA